MVRHADMYLFLNDHPTLGEEDVVVDLHVADQQVLVENRAEYLDKPIWVSYRGFDGKFRLYSFYRPSEAARCLRSRPLYRCTLFIGERKYDMPPIKKEGTLEEHIKHCIHLEAAFYDTPVCTRWTDERRSEKAFWMLKPGAFDQI